METQALIAISQGQSSPAQSIEVEKAAAANEWTLAFRYGMSQLDPESRNGVMEVRNLQQLTGVINHLQSRYEERSVTKALTRISPFLDNLNSFVSVIDTFVQSNPEITALCWGGIKLVLELSIRAKDILEQVSLGLSEIGHILPRLDAYRAHLPFTSQLNHALVNTYQAVVGFCFETIKILKRHPIRNMVTSLWRNYDASVRKYIHQIQHLSRIVESESHVAKLMADETRHKQIVEMITTQNSSQTEASARFPCYAIPFARNIHFFGRTTELQRCRDALALSFSSEHLPSVVLHGTGGVGKSSVALELAYTEKAQREIILWLSANNDNKLSASFARAAASLGVHRDNANPTADRDAVLELLESTDRPWLLVFDNVERYEDLLECIPKFGNGAYVVTSRNPDMAHNLNASSSLRIPSFDPQEGGAFLSSEIARVSEEEAARALSAYIGGLPLGLKQMGGFIRETGCRIDEFLQALHDTEQGKQILDDPDCKVGLDYDHNLATAWAHSLTALDETARSILLFFSLLDPDEIAEAIVDSLKHACFRHVFPGIFAQDLTPIRYLQGLRSLIRFGLVEKLQGRNGYAIHRLVQTIVLQNSDHEARNKMFNAILELFLQNHPQSQATSDTLFGRWETCAIYASHILQLHTLAKQWRLQPNSNETMWILSFNCARFLLETGAMAKSLDLTSDTEKFCDISTKEGEIWLSYLHNNRGIIDLQHQRQSAARRWFQSAEKIRKKHLGDLDINTVAVQGNLALTLINERRWEDLIVFNETRNEVICNQIQIPVRLRSAVYDLLSLAYLETGQLGKAIEAIDTSALLNEDSLPVYSQLSGYIHFNRGNILAARGQMEDAMREMFLSLDIRKTVLGDHIQTAASCYRAAVFLAQGGKSGDALELLKESKRIYGNLGLIGNFARCGLARSAWRISKLLEEQGNAQEAVSYYREAISEISALGQVVDQKLDEQVFNQLLNYVDS